MERRAGILLHPTALPGPVGQGDLGPEAFRFLDALASAGVRIWQVLPLSPCGYRSSPYTAASAFAGNRYLVSIDALVTDGLIDGPLAPPAGNDAAEAEFRDRTIESAWRRFQNGGAPHLREAFDAFDAGAARSAWLDDWTLFAALKEKYGPGVPWTEWPEPLARRDAEALGAARRELGEAIARERFIQCIFFRQWGAVREAANARGIAVLGDLPISVAHDSADVWSHPELFDLDDTGRPRTVSGVPPDYFSATGQRWGMPTYRWDRSEAEGFRWWIERFRANLRLADLVRIDHFRGYVAYWAIPAAEPTAAGGAWRPGPGRRLFEAAREALGALPFVAEDLGVITPDVEALRDALELPGMRVLQFGFAADDSPHLPHRHVPRSVVYTGTHDNDTTRGWFDGAPEIERRRAMEYLGATPSGVVEAFVRAAFESVADTVIVPVADLLGLGSQARFNTPGETSGSWRWQMPADAFSPELADRVRRLAALTGRIPR